MRKLTTDVMQIWEKEIDDLVKDRRVLFEIANAEIPNTPMHKSCLGKIMWNTRRINILREKWRAEREFLSRL